MVTDVRVQHEYDVFKSAGAISIRVEASRDTRLLRGGSLSGEDDVTEIGLDHIKNWDFVVNNDSDYKNLRDNAIKIVESIKSNIK